MRDTLSDSKTFINITSKGCVIGGPVGSYQSRDLQKCSGTLCG